MNKKTLPILIIIILIVLGLVWYFQNQNTEPGIVDNTNQNANDTQEIDTSEWETFTDEVLGISYKHPEGCNIPIGNLYISNISNGITCDKDVIEYRSLKPIKNYEDHAGPYKDNANFTLEQIAEANYDVNLNNDNPNKPDNRLITPLRQIVINGNEAYEFLLDWSYSTACFVDGKWQKCGGSLLSETTKYIYIGNSDNTKVLEFYTKDIESDLIKNILGTLKFLD